MPRAQARVDLAAIEANVAGLRGRLTGDAALCAVVKADGYGHGAVPAARAALAGGASWLAVATAAEAEDLRGAGLDTRILVMGALCATELERAIGARADVAAWHPRFVESVAGRAPIHVKLDTGMGRLGTRDPDVADATVTAAGDGLAGLWTHFATADERDDRFFDEQLGRFRAWALPHRERRPGLKLHAANSAATLRDPAAHFDMVRCGVAIYGLDPFGVDPAAHGLRPALELRSYVAELKACEPGESAGYGRRFIASQRTCVATVPIGYGDGWRRALTNNGDVLIRGRRFPLAGTVSMDNLTVDVGPRPDVRRGDEVVLIGGALRAEEVARRIGTINYEVTTGLTARVPRVHHRDGEPPGEA
ncbi:alanine racemase [Capillimicrobium parvum]|uniref:Alanine racemase n=1 Tax=Capillimicrobium parvum TaxID=2884022 RepID=A0A9E6Y133_9ACTN|nr:alanine racemase [Capillimicrobium parvum]UGS37672.1 Alanine racemase 2 [Capillimicrobium parvum]